MAKAHRRREFLLNPFVVIVGLAFGAMATGLGAGALRRKDYYGMGGVVIGILGVTMLIAAWAYMTSTTIGAP